jgi:hypothetical protein
MKPSSKRVCTLIARAALFECEPFHITKGAKSGRSSLDVASRAHSLAKLIQERVGLGSSGNPKDAIELRRLLRMRGERPRHSAADKRKEISPFQWQLISLNLLTALWASFR